jgi:hypothetical protein
LPGQDTGKALAQDGLGLIIWRLAIRNPPSQGVTANIRQEKAGFRAIWDDARH